MASPGGGICWRKAAILAGAIIALVIGSGFATGQELFQYFTAYGLQCVFAIAVFAILFIYYNFNFAKVGAEQRYEVGNDVFKYFCGKTIGTAFDYYSTLFCYMSFFVMVGGAASTLHQGFGIPEWVGGVLLAGLVILVVAAGLNKLVNIIGVIGPIKIGFFVVVGIAVLIVGWPHISEGLETIASGTYQGAEAGQTVTKAGGNWLMSGLSYAGFVLLWFSSFTTLLGAKNELKNLKAGIIIATVTICAAILIIVLAQIANINTTDGTNYVWNAAIPNLILAESLNPALSVVYAVVVFVGICATAVPLLYNPVARFAKEGTRKFRILAVVLGVSGLVIGLFVPYRMLVNVVYVLNGYVGAVLLIFMVRKNTMDRRTVSSPRPNYDVWYLMKNGTPLPAEEVPR
ncbi:YkvI family membrane protein [Adlercreutzia sp. ZJ141]|uniref:YkvI family membrane protein n=1 Tax=Adlercreutzia sp. ZJ141 TaxID=2709406 RepID=UPI00197DAF0A|nr:hypothetical protein [Adlercreutzia sp. ZJ141]